MISLCCKNLQCSLYCMLTYPYKHLITLISLMKYAQYELTYLQYQKFLTVPKVLNNTNTCLKHLQAIGKNLCNTVSLRCWNHTFRAVKLWLRKHKACAAEIPAYISYVRELFNQCNLACYEQKLTDLQCLWSKPFHDYYMNEIHPEVMFVFLTVVLCRNYTTYFCLQVNVALGRWVLERMNVYHPFSGVTTNQSESFNATLKRLQKWCEVPVDTIVLTLYHLQAYFCNEIQRGLAGNFFPTK